MKTPLIGICRHRLATDGQGVTTLVAFHGCPLRCRYCLNEQCLRADGVWQRMDALDIFNEVMVDNLYYIAPFIHHYYIDVKDMNPDIYRRYTSQDNHRVVGNLQWLAVHADLGTVTIRLPHIPEYNTQADIDESRRQLETMGFRDFDRFEYITPDEGR